MDKSYVHGGGHHPHPLSFIATGTPYHSYLSYYGPSSAPPGAGQGGQSEPQRNGGGDRGNGHHHHNRNSANTSNTSSPLSSGYQRPLYHRSYHHNQQQPLTPTYLPYKQHYNGGGHHYYQQLSPHHQLVHSGGKDYLFYGGADRVGTKGSSKLQHLSNRLHAWKSVSIAISFLALILLICKLYDVDREIHFLQYVANEWLSPATLNRELLHNTGPLGPAVTNAHQPQVQALKGAESSPVNLYTAFNTSNHQHPHSHPSSPHHNHHPPHQQFALPLVISTSSAAQQQKITPKITPVAQPQHSLTPPLQLSQHTAGGITDTPSLQNIIFLVESLREDIDILIVELWSSRTTLVLSLVFVFVYIMSWCWMAYAIRETTSPHDVSLKTVLLLAIFAAVDIAASAGFVMVRVIMYVMRDHYFPRDMRAPVLSAEYNQLASYTALRLVTLKSSTGVVDIFVSVIVGFLTSLRVYSVICAVAFYRRARKELLNINNLEFVLDKSGHHALAAIAAANGRHHHHNQHPHHHMNGNGVLSRSASKPAAVPGGAVATATVLENGGLPNGYLPKIRLLNAHKDLEHRFSSAGGGHEPHSIPHVEGGIDTATTGSTASSSEDAADPATELKIQAADMPPHMQKSAMQSTVHALRTYTTEKHIAESVKQNFDQLYEPTWHCIVGRNWGSCVTHTKSNYIRMLYKDLTILLYKSS